VIQIFGDQYQVWMVCIITSTNI